MTTAPEILIQQLHYSNHSKFPLAAMTEIVARRDEMIPHLLSILDECVACPSDFIDNPKCMLPTYASYLLAQFRETRAYRPIIALLKLEEKVVAEIFGDSLTEDLHCVIASVFDGDETPLRGLIEDPKAAEYARGSAGLHTYETLLYSGQLGDAAVESYFRELLERRLERQASVVWNNLCTISGDLGFASLVPQIRQAFDDDLCDPSFDHLEDIEKRIRSGRKMDSSERHCLIDDAVAWMKNWLFFHPAPRPAKPDSLKEPRKLADPGDRDYGFGPTMPPPPKYPVVSRNDPCPCGSGKKFKKCCG